MLPHLKQNEVFKLRRRLSSLVCNDSEFDGFMKSRHVFKLLRFCSSFSHTLVGCREREYLSFIARELSR